MPAVKGRLCLVAFRTRAVRGGGPSSFGPSGGRWVEELDLALLNGQSDPLFDEFSEPFVDGEALADLAHAGRAHEPTRRLAPMDVSELMVGPVPARLVGV